MLVAQPTRFAFRLPQLSHASARAFSSSAGLRQALELAHEHFSPAKGAAAGPLVVLHGLYGSKQNWRGLAKAMATQLKREVTTLDLRNHGESPHAKEHTYADMAGDVAAFIETNGLENVTVVGHSMGGKVAMALALRPLEQLERLVVVDIAPGVGKISPEFAEYLTAMKEIEAAAVKSRKEADTILQKYEPDLGVRQFLLTNLERGPASDAPWKFRLPLDYLRDAIEEIGKFPYKPGDRTFDKPTLFLKGSRSKYINSRNKPLLKEYFPNSELVELDAAHWVHAERPKEFIEHLTRFLA